MKKITLKIISILLIIFNLIGVLPIKALAKYITDMDGDAKFGVISGSLSDYNHELHYAKYDDKTYIVFCTQYGETSPTGKEYEYDKDFKIELKNERKSYEKISEYIYFGYTMKYGTGLPTTKAAKKAAAATQQFVWEYIEDNINSSYGSPSRNSWNSTYMSSTIYEKWLKETEDYYNSYHNKTVSFDGKTKKVGLGETQTFTDNNNVLKDFASFSELIDGVRFKHSKGSNDLVVTVENSSDATSVKFRSDKFDLFRLMPDGTEYDSSKNSNYMYFKFTQGAVQNLMFSNYVDPDYFSITIGIESGDLELTKTDNNDTPLQGCTFKIYEDKECTEKIATATTDEKGKILFDSLSTGKIYVKETGVPKGYLIDSTVKEVSIENGKTAKVSFKNNEPLGKISIYKVDSTGAKISGVKFKIIAANKITNVSKSKVYYNKGDLVDIVTTDENNGIATKDNIPLGKYLVQEEETKNRLFIY